MYGKQALLWNLRQVLVTVDHPGCAGYCGLFYRCWLLQVILLEWVNIVYLDRMGYCRLVLKLNGGLCWQSELQLPFLVVDVMWAVLAMLVILGWQWLMWAMLAERAVVDFPGSRAIVSCPGSVGYCRFVLPRTILCAKQINLVIPKR